MVSDQGRASCPPPAPLPAPLSLRGLPRRPPHLQYLLHAPGHVVVLGPHDVGVHDTGGGIQRVHGWVDAQLGDGAGQYGGGVQVGEGGGRGGVGQVIGGHVDGLGGQRGRWEGVGGRGR